ncbi:dihydrodipicolinate reductase [Pseudofrankia asymbiotica]|uniref:Dihydrodipicolinate reductase n=1 Tax=Pseudofrankia asymbiotica TaxID=1834516 RepID=A0A1V2IJN5_9ACTN|nr:dihydrodipicolinate reductase [Pseudofrankia asymbiotica]ONH33404.1 dihydrodipicolinate reductase [Pseudofrankia asymbiotica]
MAYRVIHWATGVVTKEAVIGVLGRPDLEVVGAWARSAEKDGRDVGELYGLDPLGVRVTSDKEAVLATPADCVVFTVGRNWVDNPMETFGDLLRILRSGKNVVNLWWPTLVYPRAQDDELFKQLEQACREGGSSICTIGMDPGYGTAGLALSALALARGVKSIEMYQFMNNAFWEGEGITKFFGFGQRETTHTPILQPGVTTGYHKTTLHMLADAIGVEIDEIVEDHSVIYADEAFDVASGHIPAGTISGLRYQVKGMVGGEARVIVGHVERLREQDFPEFEFKGDGYRAEVTGEPCIRLDMTLSALPEFVGDPIAVASAMSAVNAIPRVCEAAPGVLSLLDIPPFPSKNSTTRF